MENAAAINEILSLLVITKSALAHGYCPYLIVISLNGSVLKPVPYRICLDMKCLASTSSKMVVLH